MGSAIRRAGMGIGRLAIRLERPLNEEMKAPTRSAGERGSTRSNRRRNADRGLRSLYPSCQRLLWQLRILLFPSDLVVRKRISLPCGRTQARRSRIKDTGSQNERSLVQHSSIRSPGQFLSRRLRERDFQFRLRTNMEELEAGMANHLAHVLARSGGRCL